MYDTSNAVVYLRERDSAKLLYILIFCIEVVLHLFCLMRKNYPTTFFFPLLV